MLAGAAQLPKVGSVELDSEAFEQLVELALTRTNDLEALGLPEQLTGTPPVWRTLERPPRDLAPRVT